MRSALVLIFLLTTMVAWALKPIPQVPSTITIAEVKLRINAHAQHEIQKDVDALRASERYFQVKLDRVNLYFPLIEQALREEGVPEDLKYLSVQESALISDAVSSADAVGYWQFKDFTAREVGLRVDKYIDERKNIIAASHGAAKYIKRNNFYVKNWMYAVNAYMTGPGGVKKYVNEKDVGADHMEITGKTHWYVKRFIAHVIAFKEEVGAPHSEGLSLTGYAKGENKTLEQIAKELKVDETLLTEYNKWLRGGRIPNDRTYWVVVPVIGKVPAHIANQGKHTSKRIEEPKINTKPSANNSVKEKNILTEKNDRRVIMAISSDNIEALAKKTNLLKRQIIKYNDLIHGEKIKKGEFYYIQNKKNKADVPFHVVEYGETMWEISQKHGVKMKKILKKNRMESADRVEAGRVLWLRKKRPMDVPIAYKKPSKTIKSSHVTTKPLESKKQEVSIPPKRELENSNLIQIDKVTITKVENEEAPSLVAFKLHLVQKGESLWSIAQHYEISVDDIIKLNNISKEIPLKIGQELQLTVEQPKEAQVKNTYTVKAGDTLYSIARQLNTSIDELKKLNNKNSNELTLGEELVVN